MKSIHVTGRLIVHQKIFLILMIGSLLLPADSDATGPWKGQVVDRETKKPIEGAVVLMVWYYHGGIMDQTRSYHDSEETITDAEGRFTISSRRYWSSFVFAERPDIFVFKGEYGQWQIRDYGKYAADRYNDLSQMERSAARSTGAGAVLELPRLKTREQRLRFLDLMPLARVPYDRIPKLLASYNAELRALGLPPVLGYPKEENKK